MSNNQSLDGLFEQMMAFEVSKITAEYDKEYECRKHGFYTAHCTEYEDGTVSLEPKICPLCEAERRKDEDDLRNTAEYLDKINEYAKRNISPEFFDKSFSDFIPQSKGQEAALNAVKDLITGKKNKVVIIGSNGVGKTMLGSIAVKRLGGKIFTMYEIATRIRQSYSAGSEETELQIVEDLANQPFLVIDEVGRIKNSEAVQDWFSYILDKRHSRNLPFLLLGNLHFKKDCENGGCPRCFENYFDKDILSRLKQDSTIVEVIASDNRSGKHSCTFFSDRKYKEAS